MYYWLGEVKYGFAGMCVRNSNDSFVIQLKGFFLVSEAAMGKISPDPKNFFPEINGNLTKIVWAHAVNNQTELEKALSSGTLL